MSARLVAFSTLALALAAWANPLVMRDPLITLPVAKRVNSTGSANLVRRDKARVQGLLRKNKIQPNTIVGSVPSKDQAVDYTVQVQIGNPPTTYTLLVDTGSSNTWVGSRSPYVQTQTSVQTPNSVHVDYGSGFMDGTEFTDFISLGNGLTVFGQSIGAATDSDGFDDVDGILGLGPRGLTLGTLSPDGTQDIQTVTDNLFFQAFTTQNQVAISFQPSSNIGDVNGEVTFGGVDQSKFIGSINFAPLTSSSPANQFWGIDQQIRYGSNTQILPRSSGIVDTGTTLTLLQTDAFNKYAAATGGVLDDNTGLLALTPAQFANLKSLFFIINGVTVEFTANAQIWPRALNSAIGGDSDHVFLIISDIGDEDIDFVNGMTWIERFYVVLDTTNKKVGIASTPFTQATTN